jgi:hypothetical protein
VECPRPRPASSSVFLQQLRHRARPASSVGGHVRQQRHCPDTRCAGSAGDSGRRVRNARRPPFLLQQLGQWHAEDLRQALQKSHRWSARSALETSDRDLVNPDLPRQGDLRELPALSCSLQHRAPPPVTWHYSLSGYMKSRTPSSVEDTRARASSTLPRSAARSPADRQKSVRHGGSNCASSNH